VLTCYSFGKNFFPLHFAAGDCVSSHFKAASEHCDIGGAHRVPVRAQIVFRLFQIRQNASHRLAAGERMQQSEMLAVFKNSQNQSGHFFKRIGTRYVDRLPEMCDSSELIHLLKPAIDAVHRFNMQLRSGFDYFVKKRFRFHRACVSIEIRARIKFDCPICQGKHDLVPASVIETISQAE
jgi:hypothetical protein